MSKSREAMTGTELLEQVRETLREVARYWWEGESMANAMLVALDGCKLFTREEAAEVSDITQSCWCLDAEAYKTLDALLEPKP